LTDGCCPDAGTYAHGRGFHEVRFKQQVSSGSNTMMVAVDEYVSLVASEEMRMQYLA
jgi:hypothetical protein